MTEPQTPTVPLIPAEADARDRLRRKYMALAEMRRAYAVQDNAEGDTGMRDRNLAKAADYERLAAQVGS